MHRCLVKPGDWLKSRIAVSDSEAHHLLNVLRARPGEIVGIFDGEGRDALARVDVDDDNTVALCMVAPGEHVSPGVSMTLLQAIPKGRRMDLLVEKCTELGVRRFVPVLTERGVVRPDELRGNRRTVRWRRISENAAKQCGVSFVPDVLPIRTLEKAIEEESGDGVFLVGSLQHDARPLHDCLSEMKELHPEHFKVLIGPEGDLTGREMDMAISHGAIPVGFGSLVFRVETAAIFIASVIAYEFSSS